MRAWEIITEDRDRGPEITLRSLNRQNREEKEQQASHRRHAALVRVMYNDPDRELKQIELEKARLELEELRAEIAAACRRCDPSCSFSSRAAAVTSSSNARLSADSTPCHCPEVPPPALVTPHEIR